MTAAAVNSGGSPASRRRALTWLEIVAATLLAFATVATAWSGYQATRWAGQATKASAAANAARIGASRQAALGTAQKQVDIALFVQWVEAFTRNDTVLLDFYGKRFREEFRPALDAWVATRPLTNPDAPLSPFAMPQYVLAAEVEAARLDVVASDKVSEAQRDLQRQSNYVLAAVLFATALFFAGMSARLQSQELRIILLSLGSIVFIATVIWLATMPVTFAI